MPSATETQADPILSSQVIDPAQGNKSVADILAEAQAAETAAENPAPEKPDAGKPKAEKPEADEAIPDEKNPPPEDKPKPATETPAENVTETEHGLPDDLEARAELDKAMENVRKLSSKVGEQATRAGNAESELKQIRETLANGERILKERPELVKAFGDLLEGKKPESAKEATDALAEATLDELKALEDVEEMAPLVKTVRKLVGIIESQKGEISSLKQAVGGLSSESGRTAAEDRMYEQVNKLHSRYDELSLPDGMSAEKLNLAYLKKNLDPKNPKHSEMIRRGEIANAVYQHFLKGPYGTGGPNGKPYFSSIDVAYKDFRSQYGEDEAYEAKNRIKDRRKTMEAINSIKNKKPGVASIAGAGHSPAPSSSEPKNSEEAKTWMTAVAERCDHENREMNAEESKMYSQLLERFEEEL